MLRWLYILIGCLCISTAYAYWQTTPAARRDHTHFDAPAGNVDKYEPRQVLRQSVRPIVDPTIVTADESNTASGELVIGVEVNGATRAYPINQLTGPQREIINDTLGGTAIAVTW